MWYSITLKTNIDINIYNFHDQNMNEQSKEQIYSS